MLNGGQEPADLDGPTRARIRLTRHFTVSIGWKLVAVALADFVLLRIWAPDLINMHSDLALAVSIACLIAAVAITLWLGFQLWIDLKRYNLAKRDLARSRVYEIEP
jgi:hypothetical protein